MAEALFLHERIITTVPKAKEVRRFAEKLITLAKEGTLHARRRAIGKLRNKQVVSLLFKEVAPLFKNRNGGYTRIIRLGRHRPGDNAEEAILELVERRPTQAPKPKAAKKKEEKPKAEEKALKEERPKVIEEKPRPKLEEKPVAKPSEKKKIGIFRRIFPGRRRGE